MSLMNHSKVMLSFSGGKDSLAALYLLREWLDCITVVHVDTGAIFPHMSEFIADTCSELGATLKTVRPAQGALEYTREKGLPSDIVPVWAASEHEAINRKYPSDVVQSCITCCQTLRWAPLHQHVKEEGYTLVVRGAKKADSQGGVAPGYVEDGVVYDSPIWEWTDQEVFSYLEQEGASLPNQYNHHDDVDSLECWLCTAWVGHMGPRMRYMTNNYPELLEKLLPRIERMQDIVERETKRVRDDVQYGSGIERLRRGVG